jgi:hypothetical protein
MSRRLVLFASGLLLLVGVLETPSKISEAIRHYRQGELQLWMILLPFTIRFLFLAFLGLIFWRFYKRPSAEQAKSQ